MRVSPRFPQPFIHQRRLMSLVVSALLATVALAQTDGTILRNGSPLFPIGFYELPEDDAALATMASSGVNLIRCGSKEDLDRVQAVGAMGWMPLPLNQGLTDAFKSQVEGVKDHPALAVWEGPDEIVWNFTAFSGLFKSMGVYETKDEWWRQTPKAISYSETQAADIIPKMRDAVAFIRSVDTRKLPVWINEAQRSDVRFVRECLRFVDITGCDAYPITSKERPAAHMGATTTRWIETGKGKPVWMVMQAFSWDELGEEGDDRATAYPSFAESRLMAYDVIARGGKGLLYWGSSYLKNDEFRRSLYDLTAELAALQPFLIAPNEEGVKVHLVELEKERSGLGVFMTARHAGDDWLIILANEDSTPHMGVEVSGLSTLEGRDLACLYSDETLRVTDGELIVRMQPLEVKVFATSRSYETAQRDARGYPGQ